MAEAGASAENSTKQSVYGSSCEEALKDLSRKYADYRESELSESIRAFTASHLLAGNTAVKKRQGQIVQQPLSGEFVPHPIDDELDLPRWSAPFCAPFCQEFTGHWLEQFQRAKDYALSRNYRHMRNEGGGKENKESVEESFVYIPVKSYGGDVACLRSMLAAINAAKSEFSDKGRKLKIVTHALGDIASCGFIFYMMGDERLAVESARFLCHQPSVGVVPESERTATDDAEKLYCNLKFTEEDIYDMAESSLFSEANIEEYEMSNLKRKREEERKKWAKERHLALIALHNSLQLQGEDNVDTMITKLETDGDENVFKFTTEKVCKDTHDCFIIAFDFYAIGMCHHPGVNINYEERYSIIAKRDDPYWSRMHRRHHDLFEPRHNDSPQPKTKSE